MTKKKSRKVNETQQEDEDSRTTPSNPMTKLCKGEKIIFVTIF